MKLNLLYRFLRKGVFSWGLLSATGVYAASFEISTAPLQFLLKDYRLGLEWGVADNYSIGAVGVMGPLRPWNNDGNIYGGVLSLKAFKSSFFQDSWYVSVHGGFVLAKIDVDDFDYSNFTSKGKISANIPVGVFGALIGYHWVYSSGFTMAIGFGGEKDFSSSKKITLSSGRSVVLSLPAEFSPGIDFTLGWQF